MGVLRVTRRWSLVLSRGVTQRVALCPSPAMSY